MSERESTIVAVRRGLARRNAAERRFRFYGLAAIGAGLGCVLALFSTIIGNGYTALWQGWIELEVEYSAAVIDPAGERHLDTLQRADYQRLVKNSIRERFPQVKRRSERRSLYGLVSSGASWQLRDRLLANPQLIGERMRVRLPADDDVDMFLKGYVGRYQQWTTESVAELEQQSGKLSIISDSNSFLPAIREIRDRLRERQSVIEYQLQELNQRLERAESLVGDGVARLSAEITRQQGELERVRGWIDGGELDLGAIGESLLVAVNGGVFKVEHLEQDRLTAGSLIPADSLATVAAGDWQLRLMEEPQSQRRIDDQEVAWLWSLQQGGEIGLSFNTTLFTAGDSREPELAGIWSAVKGSFYTLLVTLLLSFPIAVAAAVYLEEFAPKNRWTDLIEVNINNLAAVPSIVFGLLGLAVFINLFGLPRSVPLVGGLVLTLMTLPTIIISSRAALRSVPPSIREAALGVGASPIQTQIHHVLPLALPGMLTGTIIGMAQALGETAPLLMIGMVAFIVDVPQSMFDPSTVLPVQIYLWADSPERAFVERTSAAIMALLAFLITMNAFAVWLRRRFERRW